MTNFVSQERKKYEVYKEIAERYIKLAEENTMNNPFIHEAVTFLAYHAFESIGCAFISYSRRKVPLKHEKKINTFIALLSSKPPRIKRPIAALAIAIHSIRNKVLYPEKVGSSYKAPSQQISPSMAKKIVRRVKGIIRIISRETT